MARRKAGIYTDWWEVGIGGDARLYRVHYWEDPPVRIEAIRFFNSLPVQPSLLSAKHIPRFLLDIPIADANEYLRKNPIRNRYGHLSIQTGVPIRDDDLKRLEYFPELEYVYLWNDAITDEGVRHLRHLRNVRSLVLYSKRVTDACLDTLRGLRTLRNLDLQISPGLSRAACDQLVRDLGGIEAWLPRRRPTPLPPSRWARFRGAVRRIFDPRRS